MTNVFWDILMMRRGEATASLRRVRNTQDHRERLLLRDPPETIGRDDRDDAAADPHEAQVLQPFQCPIYPTARGAGEFGEFFLRHPHRRTAGAPRADRKSVV